MQKTLKQIKKQKKIIEQTKQKMKNRMQIELKTTERKKRKTKRVKAIIVNRSRK